MLTNGTVLHGRYRIVREIGHGGMGAVYEAIDSRLQNTVAVKLCRLPGLDANRAFEREAKLLASLRHPSLPVVIDYFVDGEAQYLVMQFIEGDDLGKLLENRRDRFPSAEVVLWARTVLDALSYLHDHQPPVVHRDIKPSNLRRTPRGEIVLLDFGLAKGRSEEVALPRPDRSVFGYTLGYSPPEQILRRKTDARSDVYAVGATLYHLLTGRPPVNALDRMQAVESGRLDPLPGAHLVGPDVPETLGRLISRAMALTAADRYASARDMRAALNDCGVDQTTHVSTTDRQGASRRIDVAAPSRAEVGRQIDLLVQVRFDTSTRLGLEDWPAKVPPDEIEQGSEGLQLAYPTDPQTGRFLPARLRIKLVAPDFRVDGQPERLIEVPPDEYSKRLAFLLTPLRAGSCRINVEVYGLDDLFLGAVPVEIMAVAGAVSEQEIRVGNLVLDVVARQVAALLLGARLAAPSAPASLAAADAGSAAIPMPTSSVPMMEGAAVQIAAPAGASAPSPDTQTSGRLTGRGDEEAPSPKTGLSRVARVAAPLAVVVFAVAVLFTMRGGREGAPPVETQPATAPSAQPVTSAPVAAPPAVAPAPTETPPVATATPGSSAVPKTPTATEKPATPAPTTPPVAARSGRSSPVAPVPFKPTSTNTAEGLIAQGNLTGAARTIVGALKENPKNSELTGMIPSLYRAAEAEATNARNAADAAGVKDRPEYVDANERLQTARYSSRTAGPENAEAIVREFDAAAALFRTAAATVKSAGPDPRLVDELAIRQLLKDFVEAYNSMNAGRVRRFKPSFTEFDKNLSSTQLTISDTRIVLSPDRQTARVTLTAQYKNTYTKGAMPSASSPPAAKLTWRVQRKGDAWIFLE